MIGHVPVQAQPAEPAIGQVQVHFLAEATLRADAQAVAHQQHADQQLRIHRGAAHGAVKRRQVCAHLAQVHEAVDGAKQMACRYMPLK
jgi:hypothetical protein